LRTSSNTGTASDRLQERLARAVAAKRYAASKDDSYASSSNVPSRTGSPVANADTPRRSTDSLSLRSEDAFGDKNQRSLDNEKQQAQTTDFGSTDISSGKAQDSVNNISPKISTEQSPRPSMDSNLSSTPMLSIQSPLQAKGVAATARVVDTMSEGIMTESSPNPKTENGTEVKKQQNDEISDLQRQEEIHGYIERIDALQAKLQYLARESAESARKAAATASTSAEKKLAEKDEQIALLMEEGQKLSKTELKHMTIIKKLRAKTAEVEKENADSKKRLEKADKEKALISERLKRTEAAEKLSLERQKMVAQLQKDNEALTAERDAKDSNIAELRAQLLESTKQANADEVKAIQELVVLEKRRVSELENDLALLKIEKELAAGRAKAQLEELRAKIEREAERSRIAEVEMRAEQQMLESRLEVMRTRAEEVSSGSTGDAQAKFLRQIETLQTQYAIASENWQGIEASLTARATSLEKERDEASRRETDIRRKAREVVSHSNPT
jgi:TATA element modulatory factor